MRYEASNYKLLHMLCIGSTKYQVYTCIYHKYKRFKMNQIYSRSLISSERLNEISTMDVEGSPYLGQNYGFRSQRHSCAMNVTSISYLVE